MVHLDEKPHDEFKQSCETDSDCPHPELGQVCLDFYWDATMDGTSYGTGVACYNWEAPVCPSKESFGSYNFNYERSEWSYYVQ